MKARPLRRLICFGDSITECRSHAEADQWPARLAFLLEAEKPDRWKVYNRGIGGNTTALALDRFSADVAPLLPATVLLEFGINDAYVYPWCRISRVGLADYSRNLREMVRLIRESGGEPVLIVNHAVTLRTDLHRQGDGVSIGQHLLPYNDAVRKLAREIETPAVDLPRLLSRRRVHPKAFLAEDGVHLSARGNHLYADLLRASLKGLAPKRVAMNALLASQNKSRPSKKSAKDKDGIPEFTQNLRRSRKRPSGRSE